MPNTSSSAGRAVPARAVGNIVEVNHPWDGYRRPGSGGVGKAVTKAVMGEGVTKAKRPSSGNTAGNTVGKAVAEPAVPAAGVEPAEPETRPVPVIGPILRNRGRRSSRAAHSHSSDRSRGLDCRHKGWHAVAQLTAVSRATLSERRHRKRRRPVRERFVEPRNTSVEETRSGEGECEAAASAMVKSARAETVAAVNSRAWTHRLARRIAGLLSLSLLIHLFFQQHLRREARCRACVNCAASLYSAARMGGGPRCLGAAGLRRISRCPS